MRDLLLWVPDWLANGLLDAAALVSRRVWARQRYCRRTYFVHGPEAMTLWGRWTDGPDGWVPGRYV